MGVIKKRGITYAGGGGGEQDRPTQDFTVTGTFVTGANQYDKVDVNCGFKPDYIQVILPFSSGNTYATYDVRLSSVVSHWVIPMEHNDYTITLGSTTGETGISDITPTGFKFRCNAGNTRNVQCTYTATKFASGDYSTTEHLTGRKWIDGRDIYELTYVYDSYIIVGGGAWVTTDISNVGIGLILDVRGISDSGTFWGQLGGARDSGNLITVLNCRDTQIRIKYLTVEYVKST